MWADSLAYCELTEFFSITSFCLHHNKFAVLVDWCNGLSWQNNAKLGSASTVDTQTVSVESINVCGYGSRKFVCRCKGFELNFCIHLQGSRRIMTLSTLKMDAGSSCQTSELPFLFTWCNSRHLGTWITGHDSLWDEILFFHLSKYKALCKICFVPWD